MHRGIRATEREKVVIILEATQQRQDMVFVEHCIDKNVVHEGDHSLLVKWKGGIDFGAKTVRCDRDLHDTVDGGSVGPECLADDKVDTEADGCKDEKDISIGFAGCHVCKEFLEG
jgi:hypothetical protein